MVGIVFLSSFHFYYSHEMQFQNPVVSFKYYSKTSLKISSNEILVTRNEASIFVRSSFTNCITVPVVVISTFSSIVDFYYVCHSLVSANRRRT